MKARVLIVEDVKEMGDLIRLYLSGEGIETEARETGELGWEEFHRSRYDLVVLDLNLPGMDGFEFLQRLRKESAVPVVIVSARDTDEDMILGLGIGADDFVTKPFSPKVLAARIRAVLRRVTDARLASHSVVRFGPFCLDMDGYLLKRDEERIALSSREFEVLAFLAAHPGKAFTPETIYGEVWKNAYGDLTAVAVYIQRIRRKIEEDPAAPRWIETVHGMGYRFNAEPAPPARAAVGAP